MKLHKFPNYLRLSQQFGDMEHKVGSSDSLPELTLHMNAYHVWSEEVDWLSQHGRFSLNPSNSPTDYTESINHCCMRICAHNSVRVVDPALLQHSLGEVLKIYLMADSDPRWYYIEALEGLHAPLQELVPRAIPLELHLQIKLKRVGPVRKIDLYRVVDDKIHRNERFND